METGERFNLRWHGFEANIKLALRDVRDEREFSDVTLVAGDGKQVKANKVILAGGSSFFFNILRENPHPHPLIYLKGVSHNQLLSFLDYLYTGEASIVGEDLNTFLDIAEDLKVKGLTPAGSQTKSNPSTSAPVQSQGAAEEPGPSPRVYHHSTTSTIPATLQNQVAAKEAVASPGISHPRDITSASVHSQLIVEESATTPEISRPLNVISALQGEVATEEHVPSPKSSRPLSMVASDRDNAFPQATCKENHVSTNNVKVEVGDAELYNVSYGLNDHREHFIRHVSIRGLGVNEENAGCKGNISNVEVLGDSDSNFENTKRNGDLYEQSEECQSEGMWLSEKQEKNEHVFPTGKKPKQEIIDSSTDVVISEAMANEHLNYDWYERGQENNRMVQAEPEEDDYFELDKIDNSLANFNGKQEIVDSNCDMDAKEAADNIFINEQKPFQCAICFKRFSRVGTLKDHKALHTGENPYPCLQCSKKFSRPSHLKEHMKTHTGEKPYQCEICCKQFAVKSNFLRHKLTHEKTFECLVCFKRFSRVDTLNKHKGTHTTSEKPHQCLQCFKMFSRKALLDAHKAIYVDKKSYK